MLQMQHMPSLFVILILDKNVPSFLSSGFSGFAAKPQEARIDGILAALELQNGCVIHPQIAPH